MGEDVTERPTRPVAVVRTFHVVVAESTSSHLMVRVWLMPGFIFSGVFSMFITDAVGLVRRWRWGGDGR